MLSIEYSVLCHYPSIMSKDRITLGVIFLNKTNKIACFHPTKNIKRVQNFNDELDIELLDIQLESIKDEVENLKITDAYELINYTRFYVNEIRFEAIQTIEIEDDFQTFIDETLKIYMRFDYEKKDRPNKQQQIAYFKKQFKQTLAYSNKKVYGEYGENVPFDFTVDKYVFKLFIFTGKQENKLMNTIKAFAYNAQHLRDKFNVVAVIIDDSDSGFETIKKILHANCHSVISSSELSEYVQAIESNLVKKIC